MNKTKISIIGAIALIAIIAIVGYLSYQAGYNSIPNVTNQEKTNDLNNKSVRESFCVSQGYTRGALFGIYFNGDIDRNPGELNGHQIDQTDFWTAGGINNDLQVRCLKDVTVTEKQDYSYADYKRWIMGSLT